MTGKWGDTWGQSKYYDFYVDFAARSLSFLTD